MTEKLSAISIKYPKLKTRAVVFDFEKFILIEDYKTAIAHKVKDIGIAMLFLNAGYC